MHLGCPYTGSAADTPGCYNAAVRTHLCHDTLLVYVPIARSMAKKMIHKIKPAILGFCLIGLAACNSEPDIQISNNAVTTELPETIRQVARLGTVPLEVVVTVNGVETRQQPVSNDITEAIRIPINVPADQNNDITIRWLAIAEGERILLADFSTTTEPNLATLNVSEYNDVGPRFDFDGDGLSNLQEARENRNLLDTFDLVVPLRTTFLNANTPLIQGLFDNDISGDSREPDSNTTFSLRHDDTNLILYVCGQDEILQGDDIINTGDRYWHDDTVFVYLDGENSDNATFDGLDDFQLAFVRATGELIVAKGANNPFCPQGSCITHQFDPPGSPNTQCEYELFVEMPFSELNMTRGTPIGFDLEITDDDNGGLHEGSSGFVGFDDNSDEDPSTFATIRLE